MSPRLAIVLRFRRARGHLARFVTGSLVAHGLLMIGILGVSSLHRAPQSFDDAMVVALAGPLPGAPAASAPRPAAAPAPAPAPPKAPEPKEAHTVKEVPKPQPKATPAPKQKEEPPKKTAPEAAPPSDDKATGEASPTPSVPPGASGGGGAAGPTGVTPTLGGGSGDASLGYYGAAVKAALESAWSKPYLEEQGETYSATVSFVIARDGSARDVKIVTSSGVPSLDRSAMRAVIEASPFPPVPPAWQGDALPATMRFDLTPEGR
ncbi:MAG TPA: TonB family protein [Candidatus Bathyarchaeia archaeon]|nr:TonB family protein [Candidatus Bathyarchaeia archaeon]